MATVYIRGGKPLAGSVKAPGSKAHTHRELIASFLSDGTSRITGSLFSDDTRATLDAIRAFGAEVEEEKDQLCVRGDGTVKASTAPIDCRESGATLRFMVPTAALAPGDTRFLLGSSLRKRPLEPYLESLELIGIKCELDGVWGLLVRGGGIKGGRVSIRGDISSQFISGILFAAPKASGDTEVILSTPLESRGYVDISIDTLRKHRVRVECENYSRFLVPSNQNYSPHDCEVPGDFSSAAFLLAAATVTGSKIRVLNLDLNSIQGDKVIIDILEKMGAKVTRENNAVEILGDGLNAIDIDATDIPDLVPVCTALASFAEGRTTIRNTKRLRYKESDRLESVRVELGKMGSQIKQEGDSLIISGPCRLHGATIDPRDDHRIAMACIVAALGTTDETTIANIECIRKSYPGFIMDIRSLGAEVVEQ